MNEVKTEIDKIRDYERAKDAGLDGVTDVDFNSLNECEKRGYRAGKMIRSKIIYEVIHNTRGEKGITNRDQIISKKSELIKIQARGIGNRNRIIIKQEEVIDKYKSIIYCLCLLVTALTGGVCYFAEVF